MKNITALLCSLLLISATALAQETSFKEFGNYEIHYSAFNSSFISPEVASVYDINRGKDRGLVNIAVVPEGAESGETALVEGAVTDLLQRQQTLEFVEIREGDAVYYLAPFRFGNEDPLTFRISVTPTDSDEAYDFNFQRTLYQD